MGEEKVLPIVNASGNGGQKIFIVPELELVAVFTGSNYNAPGTPPNQIMTDLLLPALFADKPK